MPPAARAETEYSLADGLSQNSVLSLVRDEDGFLWVGTEDGLNRFDGYEFRVYRPQASDAVSAGSNYIDALQASGRYLFLATGGGGLAIFDRFEETFRRLGVADGLPAEHLTALAMAGPDTLFVGTRNGLARLHWQGDPMTAAITATPIGFGANARQKDIWDLHAGASGVWIATGDGVFRAAPDGRVEPLQVAGAQAPFNVDSVLEAPAGVLWVGTWEQGLFRIDLGSHAVRRFLPDGSDAAGLRSARVTALEPGPDGSVFVGSDRGLSWFAPDCDCLRMLEQRRAERVAGRGFLVLALLADARGGVFAGYWGEGMVRFTPYDRVFHVEQHRDEGPPSLGHDRVRALLEDRSGDLWVGSYGGGVQRVRRANRVVGSAWQFESMPFPAPASEAARLVWSLVQDGAGRLWAGTDDGVYWTAPDRIDWQRERPYGEDVPMSGVRQLLVDDDARLWVGSSEGLGRIDAPGSVRRRIPLSQGSNQPWLRRQDESVHGLYQDSERRIWVGTSGGLHILDPDGAVLARYRASDGLPGPIVWSVYRYLDGSLWLATSGGLARVVLDGHGIEHLAFDNVSKRAGLPEGGVFGVVGDRQGQLWLTGDHGLVRFDPQTLTYRVWTRAEGIASNEFTTNAVAQGADGWLYFGGIDGITAFDPAALRDQLEAPRPTVTRITRGDQVLPPGVTAGAAPELQLSHDHPPLIIDVAGMLFDAPAAARYSYRLDRHSRFTELGPRRSLILDRLPYGPHALELAVDNRGLRVTRPLLAIDVIPPLTATWPFRLALAFALVLVLALLYLRRIRQLRRRAEELERVVEHRTSELAHERDQVARQATRLHELAEGRARFMSGISHELRTPLSLILAPLTDIVEGRHGALSDSLKGEIGRVRRNAERLLRLVERLLEVARIEAGEQTLHCQPGDLSAVIRSLVEQLQPLAEQKGSLLQAELPDMPVPLWFDGLLMESVLVNLMVNGLRHTPTGSRVRVDLQALDDTHVLVQVCDDGPGIPADALPLLFERFFRVRGEHASGADGFGLGLPLVREVVERHGGTVEVDSSPAGTCFRLRLRTGRAHLDDADCTIRLPQRQPSLTAGLAAVDDDATEPDRAIAGADERKLVLVVDDNPELRRLLRSYLQADFRVVEAGSGRAGLDCIAEQLPDLIISDVMMPAMDGHEFCRILRSSPDTDFLPLLMLTAKAGLDHRIEGLELGADGYLGKPFDRRELMATVRGLLAARQRLRVHLTRQAGADSGRSLEEQGDPSAQTRAEPEQATAGPSPAEARFRQRLSTVLEHRLSDEDFDVDALAAAMAQDRSTLYRTVKAQLGVSPSELLRETRLLRAREMLERREGNVSEVAYAVGFKTVAHFSNSFRQRFGQPPSQLAGRTSAAHGLPADR